MNIEPVYFYHQLRWLSRNMHSLAWIEQNICSKAFIRIEYTVKKEQRHEIIIQQVEATGPNYILSTRELSNFLSVSEMTIRRDLSLLERKGELIRKYGGATSAKRATFEFQFRANQQKQM